MSIGEVVDIDTSIRLIMEAFAERKEALVKELLSEVDFFLDAANHCDEGGFSEFSKNAQAAADFRLNMIDRIRNI
jgi:hypothetical protein